MKINKTFAIFEPDNPVTKTNLIRLIKHSYIKVPKKAKGFVFCAAYYNNVTIYTYSFCSHQDEWDENVGKRIASERLYEIINKLERN